MDMPLNKWFNTETVDEDEMRNTETQNNSSKYLKPYMNLENKNTPILKL